MLPMLTLTMRFSTAIKILYTVIIIVLMQSTTNRSGTWQFLLTTGEKITPLRVQPFELKSLGRMTETSKLLSFSPTWSLLFMMDNVDVTSRSFTEIAGHSLRSLTGFTAIAEMSISKSKWLDSKRLFNRSLKSLVVIWSPLLLPAVRNAPLQTSHVNKKWSSIHTDGSAPTKFLSEIRLSAEIDITLTVCSSKGKLTSVKSATINRFGSTTYACRTPTLTKRPDTDMLYACVFWKSVSWCLVTSVFSMKPIAKYATARVSVSRMKI